MVLYISMTTHRLAFEHNDLSQFWHNGNNWKNETKSNHEIRWKLVIEQSSFLVFAKTQLTHFIVFHLQNMKIFEQWFPYIWEFAVCYLFLSHKAHFGDYFKWRTHVMKQSLRRRSLEYNLNVVLKFSKHKNKLSRLCTVVCSAFSFNLSEWDEQPIL